MSSPSLCKISDKLKRTCLQSAKCASSNSRSADCKGSGRAASVAALQALQCSAPKPTGFQGWWALDNSAPVTDNAIIGGFVNPYIFIDTSAAPFVRINPYAGTRELPHPGVVGYEVNAPGLSHVIRNSTELISVFDREGPTPNINSAYAGTSYKLIDCDMLVATLTAQPTLSATFISARIYRRITLPPPTVLPAIQNDPIFLAQYLLSGLKWLFQRSVNVNFNDADFIGAKRANALIQQFFGEGFARTTPIRRLRASNPAASVTGLTDKLTDLYTGDPQTGLGRYSYATSGSNVVIKGFCGEWAAMNGVHINGVAIPEAGAIINYQPELQDSGPHGDFHNLFHHLLLRFNSSNRSIFSNVDPATNLVRGFDGEPTITVVHRFRPDMEYAEFIAAAMAMMIAMYRVVVHVSNASFGPAGSAMLFETWEQLRVGFRTGVNRRTADFLRLNQASPQRFYNNIPLNAALQGPVAAISPTALYNDPYGISTALLSQWDYCVDMTNYLVNPRALYWGIQGTLDANQPNPVVLGYPPVFPGPGRAQFVGAIGVINMVNGRPVPVNPDVTRYRLMRTSGINPTTEMLLANANHFGQINPAYTLGRRIGYIRWADTTYADPANLMTQGLFAPENPFTSSNPRIAREAQAQVFAVMMQYLVQEVGMESIIIDIRGGYGGTVQPVITLAEFFGAQRAGYSNYTDFVPQLDDPVIRVGSIPSVNDALRRISAASETLFVDMNRQRYPAAVWPGGSDCDPRQVVILDDVFAFSGDDFFPHMFLGDRQDGAIGCNTFTTIVGDLVARLKGTNVGNTRMPLPAAGSIPGTVFVNATNVPQSVFQPNFDGPTIHFRYGNGQYSHEQVPGAQAVYTPFLHGTAGNAPLPSSWERTVYVDIGAIAPHPDPRLPGDTRARTPSLTDRATWRDRWLEEAVRQTLARINGCQLTCRETPSVTYVDRIVDKCHNDTTPNAPGIFSSGHRSCKYGSEFADVFCCASNS